MEQERSCEQACRQYDYAQAAEVIVDIARKLHQASPGGEGRFGDGPGWSVCFGAYTHGGTQGPDSSYRRSAMVDQPYCEGVERQSVG